MDSTSLAHLYKFFGLWQISVCIFSATALLFIWRQITKESQQNRDLGLVWLSLAICTWAISGIFDLLNGLQLMGKNYWSSPSFYEGSQSILSMLNSALILFALPYFRHIPKIVSPIIKSPTWKFLVSITFGFSALVTLLMISGIVIPSKVSFIYSIDLIYAIFTLIFLGFVLWDSFEKRGLKKLSYLSAICIICTLAAQIFKLGEDEFWRLFFSCTFKTILIMLFFSLALGWVKEIAKIIVPSPTDLHLVMIGNPAKRNSNQQIVLTIPPIVQTKRIQLTNKAYALLAVFCKKKLEDTTAQNGWLEIKPKSDKAGNYDISDYNEINRLLDQLVKSISPDKSENLEEVRMQIKQSLFEYGNNRKVRLRIPSNNIFIESAV